MIWEQIVMVWTVFAFPQSSHDLPRFQENLSSKIVARPFLDFLILLKMIEAAKIASFMPHWKQAATHFMIHFNY